MCVWSTQGTASQTIHHITQEVPYQHIPSLHNGSTEQLSVHRLDTLHALRSPRLGTVDAEIKLRFAETLEPCQVPSLQLEAGYTVALHASSTARDEDKADRGRGGITASGNGHAWSSVSPRGKWRTGENGEN